VYLNKCIRCGSEDVLTTEYYYRCNICGNKSAKLPSEEKLTETFFQFIAMSDYIDNNGTFLSKGKPMSFRWQSLCNELAKIAIEEIK